MKVWLDSASTRPDSNTGATLMLDKLIHEIELLRRRIQKHRDELQANEIAQRMALVDPLLQALGWNVADPAIVMPEYDAGGGRVDYALLGPGRNPDNYRGGERLGESLSNHRLQMLNYANAAGIGYAALTDGNHWELYDVFTKAHSMGGVSSTSLSI